MNGFQAFEEFNCPVGIHPVVCAQMYSFYHQSKLSLPQTQSANQPNSESINVNTSEISSKVIKEDPSPGLGSVLGQVWVDNTYKAICILANSMKVLQGKTNKITQWLSCMIEAGPCNNLPRGVVVNRTMVTPNKNK